MRWLVLGLCVAGCGGAIATTAPPSAAPVTQVAEAPPPAPIEQPAAVPAPVIVDRLLPFPEQRLAATRAYRVAHQGGPADHVITPQAIVLHWTGGGSADGAWATFAPPTLAGRADVAAGGDLNVSAHFLVDRDGTIYRLMPDDWMARHCIGINHVAIGVENVGDGAQHPLTPAQVAANVALVRWLASRWPITHLLGHHEYQRMDGHPLFVERDAGYRTVKVDPGDAFMAQVRASVADLGLQAPP